MKMTDGMHGMVQAAVPGLQSAGSYSTMHCQKDTEQVLMRSNGFEAGPPNGVTDVQKYTRRL